MEGWTSERGQARAHSLTLTTCRLHSQLCTSPKPARWAADWGLDLASQVGRPQLGSQAAWSFPHRPGAHPAQLRCSYGTLRVLPGLWASGDSAERVWAACVWEGRVGRKGHPRGWGQEFLGEPWSLAWLSVPPRDGMRRRQDPFRGRVAEPVAGQGTTRVKGLRDGLPASVASHSGAVGSTGMGGLRGSQPVCGWDLCWLP